MITTIQHHESEWKMETATNGSGWQIVVVETDSTGLMWKRFIARHIRRIEDARLIANAKQMFETLHMFSDWFDQQGYAPLHSGVLLGKDDRTIGETIRDLVQKIEIG